MELKLSDLNAFRSDLHQKLLEFKHYKRNVKMFIDLKDNVKVCLVKRIRNYMEYIDVTLIKDSVQPIFLLTFWNRINSRVPMALLNVDICSQIRQLMFHRLGHAGEIVEFEKDIYKEWIEAGAPISGELFLMINIAKLQYMNSNGLHAHKSAFIM